MPKFKLDIFILFFSLTLLSSFCLTGCSDNITNSSETERFFSHSEKEFTDNPNLRASDSGVVVLNLEALNAPTDSIPDTYARGIDIIPYTFGQDGRIVFRIGDSSYFSVKLVKEATGDTLFRLFNPNDSAALNIQSGNYKLIVQSAFDYNVSPVEDSPVFIEPPPLPTANKDILLRTKSCSKCDLRGVDLTFANLREANLTLADLSRAIISFTNLSKARLDYTKMTTAVISYSNLDSASLSNSDMTYSILSNSRFNNANFFRSTMNNTYLTLSIFNYTNFNNASLVFANFGGSEITNSNLNGADISAANLCGTVFTNNQVSGIRYNSLTRCYP